MALFQQPARTPEEVERGRPLELAPDEVAALDAAAWRARAFRGEDAPQLTLRAVGMGSLLGFFLAFTNLYIGLKTGWGVGVAITACILAFSIWNALLRAGLARTPMSILESNCMQSTASAAGYSTGSTMVAAIPAMLLLTVTAAAPGGRHMPWPVLAGWTLFTAALGVCLAVPMKRNMIDQERLRFPSGTAAAVTLRALYSEGRLALRQARALLGTGLLAALTPLVMDLKLRAGGERAPLLPAESPLLDLLPARGTDPATGARYSPSDWTMVMDHKLLMIAAGALTGLRVCLSMALGGLLLAYVVGPAALEAGAAKRPATAWREIGVWVGAPIMVAAGLTAFAWQWRTIARALGAAAGALRASVVARSARADRGPAAASIEVPGRWVAVGTAAAACSVVAIGQGAFGVPWPLGLLSVALSFVLALVACRATGETDITPIGAMGKLTQLAYGVLLPQNATANLMTAAVTANVAASSADLLTDLKSGYLLGAHPRRQFVAQLSGIFAGTAATTLGFYVLVPDARVLTGAGSAAPDFPAPAAQAWLAVARVFQQGVGALHPMAQRGIAVGLGIGALLAAAEALAPRARRFLPSATGIGLGFILPFQYPLSMLLGALGAWAWTRRSPASAERYLVPVASGIIAGESISGVAVAATNNFVLAGK